MHNARVLIVHSDAATTELLTSMLRSLGSQLEQASSDRAAVRTLEKNGFDLVLVVVDPADPEALELLSYVRRKFPGMSVVLLFTQPHSERTREARRLGATAVLRFPLPASELRATVAQALELIPSASPIARRSAAAPSVAAGTNHHHPGSAVLVEPAATTTLRRAVPASGISPWLIGDDPSLRQAVELAATIAPTSAPVLILGEPGTGKNLLGRLIHDQSPRREGPLVEMACDPLDDTEQLVELFGAASRPGKLEQAHGGTLVLGDVAALSSDAQFRLVRLLQTQELEPVDGGRIIRVDVRLILTTRDDLAPLVAQGGFRQDLYYRIGVVCLKLPPLRLRGADIERLAEHFRVQVAHELGRDVGGFTPEALEHLRKRDWPGNVAELAETVRRAVALCRGSRIMAAHLTPPAGPSRTSRSPNHMPKPHVALGLRPLKEALAEPEKQIILQTLDALNWNRQETARVLDINRTTLYKKMKKYGLLIDEPAWLN